MSIKYSNHYLNKLEDLFAESDYHLRYEKGNFKSGYCVLKDQKIVIVNKYYSLEGKINCLLEIIKSVDIDNGKLSDKNRKLFLELQQIALAL
jgi:hypothetical protein